MVCHPRLDYVKTKPGILHAISLGVGFFSLLFILVVYTQGNYFGGCPKMSENYGVNISCGVRVFGTTQLCEHVVSEVDKQKEFYEKNKSSIDPTDRKWMEYGFSQLPSSCPTPETIQYAVSLIALSWLASLLMLIITMLVDLKEHYLFEIAEITFLNIFHWLICGFLFISTCYHFAFLIELSIGKYPCTQQIYDDLQDESKLATHYQSVFLDDQVWTWEEWVNGGNAPSKNDPPPPPQFPRTDCMADTESTYKFWYLAIGMVLTGVTSFLHSLTGRHLHKHGMNFAPVPPQKFSLPPKLVPTPEQEEMMEMMRSTTEPQPSTSRGGGETGHVDLDKISVLVT